MAGSVSENKNEKGRLPEKPRYDMPRLPSREACEFPDYASLLPGYQPSVDDDEFDLLRRHQRTGRPLGDDAFVERLEARLGRTLRPRKPGPKPRKGPRQPRDR